MGDYNIDTLSDINNNSKTTQDCMTIFSTYYYHKLINHPTREINQTASLIDNILYTNIPDCYYTCTSGVLRFLSQSDHYPVFTTRTVVKKTEPKTEITRKNHSNKSCHYKKKNLLRRKIGRNYMI